MLRWRVALSQSIEVTTALERVQLVTAADVLVANPYLRHAVTARSHRHSLADRCITINREFLYSSAICH